MASSLSVNLWRRVAQLALLDATSNATRPRRLFGAKTDQSLEIPCRQSQSHPAGQAIWITDVRRNR